MIVYSANALVDLARLRGFIEFRDPRLLPRFAKELAKSEVQIARRPMAHPATGDGAARKHLMKLGRSAYVIYFQIDGADQVILRIWHGRELRA